MRDKNTSRRAAALKLLALTSTALVGLALPMSAQAQEWTGTGAGNWFNSGNWNPGHVPTASDDVKIDDSTVKVPSLIGTGQDGAANHITIGDTNTGNDARLSIGNGGTLTSTSGILGNLAGSKGFADIGGVGSVATSYWTNSGTLIIGNAGHGTLSIGIGEVKNTDGMIGALAGSEGFVGLSGPTALWTNGNTLTVGGAGVGTLNITNGATVSNLIGYIGNLAGATGTVNLGGAGSTWTNSSDLHVGEAGSGTLNITNGGTVTNVDGFIGAGAGGAGTVTVDGGGSVWTSSGSLYVGNDGSGILSITNGGTVNSGFTSFGSSVGTTGTGTVDGVGSKLAASGNLTVGSFGTGTLTISNGGEVINQQGTIGATGGSAGTVMVDGAGSIWLNNGLTIGDAGTGTLDVTNGGWVGGNIITVAKTAGSTGDVTVDGAVSKLFSASSLSIGERGNGTLTLSNGGTAENIGGYLGFYAGASGTATITGAGSTWTNSNELYVGAFGAGTLDIENGGTVTSGSLVHIASETGSTGTVNVKGANASLTAAGQVVVGDSGTGTLDIRQGGSVTSAGGVIGVWTSGAVTIDGAGSKWASTGDLYVAGAGTGTLNITHGGALTSAIGYLGYSVAGTGTVTVSGAGSSWTATSVGVGLDGTGTLNILNGGVVNAGGPLDVSVLGSNTGSKGFATVSGAGSTWNTDGDFAVGLSGAGTLNVSNGGKIGVTNVGNAAAGNSYIGANAGSVGTATVDGAGSSWTSAGDFTVGRAGTGRLDVTGGGTVTSLTGTIGTNAGSSGLVFVQDAGSRWNVTNDLIVGESGHGSLVISSGKVSVGGTLTIAKNAGASGDLNIGGNLAPGTLDATNVQFGAGAGRIILSHTSTNYNFDAAISGLGTINQSSGVTHLTADSSGFTGQTHITGGTLLVDGKLGTGAVDVQTGGTLGGKGLIGGNVTIASGGTITGIQGQTLTMQNLDLASGANVNVTLSTPGGAALFAVNNNLTLDGTLNITSGGAFGPGVYALMTYGGALTNNGLDIGTTPTGSTASDFTVQTAVAGQVNLVSTALPSLAFWDGAGAGNANNNIVDGGSGVWTAASTNWTDANGTTNGVMHPQPGFAIFQGTAGAVTADASAGAISVTGMQFATDGYQITGAAITLADPNSIIRVGDGSAAGANYKATIGSVLTGAGGLNKTDLGTLILTADNTYTGGTTITDGALQLGNGGTSGSVVGNITSNGLLIFNRSDVSTYAGAISGTGAIYKIGSGTINLTGDSSGFSGGVQVDGGTLGVNSGGKLNSSGFYVGGSAGSAGVLSVDGASSTASTSEVLIGVAGDGTLNVTNGGKVSNAGDGVLGVLGAGKGTATISGAGSSWTNAGDLYVGGGGNGTLSIANGGTVSNKFGSIGYDASSIGAVTVDGASSKWINSGSITVGYNGTGSLSLSNGATVSTSGIVLLADQAGSTSTLNIGGTAGSAAKGAGTLNAGTLEFGQGTGTLNFNHTDTNYTFAASMLGAGTIDHYAGTTDLTGNSGGFTGAVNVKGGRLAVNGSLAGGNVTVSNGAGLSGIGAIGSLSAQSGALVAPGNGGIGTLTVKGATNFAAGSTYQVDLTGTGQSDLLKINGAATLANGALLSVVKTDAAPYVFGAHYTVLTADGGLTGTFTFNNQQLTNFMGLVGSSDANNYYLDITKTKTFASAGLTPNQIATAGGLDTLPLNSTLARAVANLSSDAAAQYAFDQLSGEVHASAKTVMIEDSRFLRNAVNDRLRAAFGGVGASGGNVVTYDGGKPRPVAADTDGGAVWGQAFGSWGHWNSDGNAARLDRSIGGFFMGADAPAFDNWRLGAVAGYSRNNLDSKARGSSGKSDNYSAGLYGGTTWGDLSFRTGAAYTISDITTSRRVSFTGFRDSLSADYRAGTAQVFGELGYKMQAGNVAFEPFANLAYVNLRTDGFSERGGVAALTSGSSNVDTTFTTLGLRASTSFDLNGMAVTAKGMVGWRHAFGDTTPNAVMSFAGSAPFSIGGVPIAKNAAVVDLGLDMNLSANTTLGVSYGGQFGSGVADQTLRANFSVKF